MCVRTKNKNTGRASPQEVLASATVAAPSVVEASRIAKAVRRLGSCSYTDDSDAALSFAVMLAVHALILNHAVLGARPCAS